MSRKDVTSEIKRDLQRYRSLRRHLDESSKFNHQLQQVQVFQQQRMRENYGGLFSDPHHRCLMEFFLEEMYAGLDLSQLGNNVDKAIKLALKLVTNPTLISATLEYSAITSELDELLTAILFENMAVDDVTLENFQQANRLANSYEVQRRKIELIKVLTKDLDRNSKSRIIYGAFKLAKGPAKLGGLGHFYGIMSKGFESIRYVKSPESLVALMMDGETKFLEEMFADRQTTVAFR